MVFQADTSDQPTGSTSEAAKVNISNYQWKPSEDGKSIYFTDFKHRDWGLNFIPGDFQLPRPATKIRLTVVVQDLRINPDHFLTLAIKVGPVLEARCDRGSNGSASVIFKHANHAFLFGGIMVHQKDKVVIETANMVGERNGLQYGSTERLKSETIEIPRPQLKFLSGSGSTSYTTIDRSLYQILRTIYARLREHYPLMPGFLFQRAFRGYARQANNLFRFNVEHAQHATLGTCLSGKYCGYRSTISSYSTNVLEPPAQGFPMKVECSICFKMKHFETWTDWTDHLYADIKPYFCTAYPCRNAIQFSSKQDWLRHEKEECQKQYWRCDVGECTTMWVDQTDFTTHLVEGHNLAEDDKLDSMQQRCRHNFHRKKETCLFCGIRVRDDLDTHLAQHMVEISEYVLQAVKQQEVTPQPIIDPIKQGEANQSHPPKSAQSTAVNYEECLSRPSETGYEQPDESLLHRLGRSSSQHLQSQSAHYGGTPLPGSAPLNSSMVFRHPENSLYGTGNTWDFNTQSFYCC